MAQRGRPRKTKATDILRIAKKLTNLHKEKQALELKISQLAATARNHIEIIAAGGGGASPAPFIMPPAAGKRTGRKKGFKMSAAARAKISAAQKARWAKQKAGDKKK